MVSLKGEKQSNKLNRLENDSEVTNIYFEDTARKLGNIILVELGHNGPFGHKEQELLGQHLIMANFVTE